MKRQAHITPALTSAVANATTGTPTTGASPSRGWGPPWLWTPQIRAA
ncbi:hypothetical protein ABH931_005399 [Streptacidiphilus sp. MAP12-33]